MGEHDIFSHFFGGGGQRFHQQREQIPVLFENTDVEMLDLSSLGRFYRRNEIWVIYFFNPKLKEC